MRTEVSTPGSDLGLRSWKFDIRAAGAESLAGVLAQCPALTWLRVAWISLFSPLSLQESDDDAGAERLAGVLPQCPALARFDLGSKDISTVGQGRLRGSWCGQASVVGNLHFLLFATCLAKKATRKSDILYTYIVVAFGLALWL